MSDREDGWPIYLIIEEAGAGPVLTWVGALHRGIDSPFTSEFVYSRAHWMAPIG